MALTLKPIHPIATILGHLRLIALVSGLGTLFLVALILWKVKPVYEAGSALEIGQTQGHVLTRDQDKQFVSRISYTDFVNTQVNYMVSYENVAKTLERVDLSTTCLKPAPTENETIAKFLTMVQVSWIPNTDLMGIRINSTDKRGLDVLANTLVDTYIEGYLERELGENQTRIDHLQKERDQKRLEIDEMNRKLTILTTTLGTLASEEQLSPLEETLSFLRSSLNEAYLERVKAEHAYQTLVNTVDKENKLGITPLVEEQVQEGAADIRNKLYENMGELNRASAFMTPEHPQIKAIEEQMAVDRKNLEMAMSDLRKDSLTILQSKTEHEQKSAIIAAQANLDTQMKNEHQLRLRYAEEQTRLKDTIPVFLNAKQLRTELEQSHERLTQIESRLEEVSIESGASTRIGIQSRAREPLYPAKDRRKIFAVLALFISLLGGLTLAFAIDLLDPSIISPQHFAQIAGTRPTGVLASHQLADFGQLLRAYPQSYEADQFRRIMPRIFNRPLSTEEPGVFVVLPLAKNAGVTSFSLNCLTHLSEIGKPVGHLSLALDDSGFEGRVSDWGLSRHPLHLPDPLCQRFSMEVLSGGGLECYRFTKPLSKQLISDREGLTALVNFLAKRTGCLLVESASILQHSEAEILCTLAEVVILVVNGPKTSQGELRRGLAILEEVEVKQCALIANNLPILPGGYFAAARAAFEGKEVKYPLVHDIIKAVRAAIPFGRKTS